MVNGEWLIKKLILFTIYHLPFTIKNSLHIFIQKVGDSRI